jgi:uncharacterized membrane protein YvbJ
MDATSTLILTVAIVEQKRTIITTKSMCLFHRVAFVCILIVEQTGIVTNTTLVAKQVDNLRETW